jgi:acyl phosphate:glycerol-3-phosphate acyltransferase
MFLVGVISIFGAYLLGSISFSYLITRLIKGVDIRDYGSGNAGATNTWRVLGKRLAAVVFVLDVLKGIAAVWLGEDVSDGDPVLMITCGIAVIFGHNWPIFLRFRGGKGIATTVGVTVFLLFEATLIAGIIAILLIIVTRYVSLGSLSFTILVPIVMFFMDYSHLWIQLYLLITLVAIIRHRQNIVALWKGQERKISYRGEEIDE